MRRSGYRGCTGAGKGAGGIVHCSERQRHLDERPVSRRGGPSTRNVHGMTAARAIRRIGFLAPMKPELRPLVQMLSLQPTENGDVYLGTFGDTSVVATLTLIGTKPAAEATERLLRDHDVDHVVVVGIAGGVPPTVAIGDVLVPEVVVDAATGKEYRPSPLGDTAMRGRIRTSDDLNVAAPALLTE